MYYVNFIKIKPAEKSAGSSPLGFTLLQAIAKRNFDDKQLFKLTNSQAGTMKPPVLKQCILLRYVPLRDSCSESVPVANC
jgi:hypothetical protein